MCLICPKCGKSLFRPPNLNGLCDFINSPQYYQDPLFAIYSKYFNDEFVKQLSNRGTIISITERGGCLHFCHGPCLLKHIRSCGSDSNSEQEIKCVHQSCGMKIRTMEDIRVTSAEAFSYTRDCFLDSDSVDSFETVSISPENADILPIQNIGDGPSLASQINLQDRQPARSSFSAPSRARGLRRRGGRNARNVRIPIIRRLLGGENMMMEPVDVNIPSSDSEFEV